VNVFGRPKVAFNNAGTCHCLKHDLRHMEPAGGVVVNTASIRA